MQAMSRMHGEIKCIPNNTKNYFSFSLGNVRFVASVNFSLRSLDSLVKGCDPKSSKITQKRNRGEENRRLLLKKGTYPYEYMDSFERFSATKLRTKEAFYSKLNGKNITEEESVWAHAESLGSIRV